MHVALHSYNDRPFIQSTRQVVPPPPGVRPEWTFYRDLALAMGKPAFGGHVSSPDEMAAGMIARAGSITLDDVRAAPHGLLYGARTMGHFIDYCAKEGRTIQLCPSKLADELRAALAGDALIGKPPAGHLRIISRRRNGMMNASLAETSGSVGQDDTAETIELNRGDALVAAIADGDWLDVRSDTGSLRARATISDAVRAGTAVLVQGWGSPLFDPATSAEVFRRGQDRNKLVSDVDIDPLSAVPRLNGTLVTLTPLTEMQS